MIIVTTGRTEEEIDPVRVITNRSSGRMGIAIARAATLAGGAKIKLVAGKTSVAIPAGLDTVRVTSTEEMLAALKRHAARGGYPGDGRRAGGLPSQGKVAGQAEGPEHPVGAGTNNGHSSRAGTGNRGQGVRGQGSGVDP